MRSSCIGGVHPRSTAADRAAARPRCGQQTVGRISRAGCLGRQLYRLAAESLPTQPASSKRWRGCGSARASCCRWRCTWMPRKLTAGRLSTRRSYSAFFRRGGVIFLGRVRSGRVCSTPISPLTLTNLRPPSSRQPGARHWTGRGRYASRIAGAIQSRSGDDRADCGDRVRVIRGSPQSYRNKHHGRPAAPHSPALDALAAAASTQGDLGRPGAARPSR